MQYRAEFPVHFPSFVLKKSRQLGKCTGNSALYCMQFELSGHMMCLQEMCMQVVYPGTGNLDIHPVQNTGMATFQGS